MGTKTHCADCGRSGHEALPGHGGCSRAFRAAMEVVERGITVPEAARLFGLPASDVIEEMRRFPMEWAAAVDRARRERADRAARPPRLVELAVLAVAGGQRVADAARAHGVNVQAVYKWSKRMFPGARLLGHQKWR